MAGYPGLYRDVQTYLRERIKEVLTGAGESIVVRLFGPDLAVLREKAHEVEAALKDIPGLIDLHVEQQVDVPQVQVTLDLEKAARYGIKPGDVRRVVNVMMIGMEVTDIHRDGKVYDVFVWSRAVSAQRRGELARFPDRHALWRPCAAGRSGGRAARADPEQDQAREQLPAHRRAWQCQGTRPRVGGGERRGSTRKASSFPSATTRSSWANTRNARRHNANLLQHSIACASRFSSSCMPRFGNLRLATLIFLALPAALVGGVLASSVADRVISLGSLVGIITVLGIAARNGILLIQHYRHLERVEGEPFGDRTRPARRGRTPLADPDDDAVHRYSRCCR